MPTITLGRKYAVAPIHPAYRSFNPLASTETVVAVLPTSACTGCIFYIGGGQCARPVHVPTCVTTDPGWRHVGIYVQADANARPDAVVAVRKWPKFLPD